MIQEKSNLVAKIELNTNTYYVTDRIGGILLDGNTYEDLVISWSDVSFFGNIGTDDNQVSTTQEITLNNGEEYSGSGYKFSPTDNWNNSTITVKKWIDGVHNLFADCIPFFKGLIKNFNIENDKIKFSVDIKNNKDDILLPLVLCEDQSGLTVYRAIARKTSEKNLVIDDTEQYNLFQIGEFVRLLGFNGKMEYNIIESKYIDGTNKHIGFKFYYNYGDFSTNNDNYIEKPFYSISTNYINKTIPIQIGDLTDTTNGVFGKVLPICDDIGKQAFVLENNPLHTIASVGIWEDGLRRYFTAKSGEIITKNINVDNTVDPYDISQTAFEDLEERSLLEGEINITSNTIVGNSQKIINFVSFKIDADATLTDDMSAVDETTKMYISDISNIEWIRDDSNDYKNKKAESISVNLLAVDNELMLMIGQPVDGADPYVIVERGYNDTEITTHTIGALIYQTNKYSSRNNLIFTEKFYADSITGQYYELSGVECEATDRIVSGAWKNVTDSDDNNYIEFNMLSTTMINFNVIFKKITTDFTVLDAYIMLDMEIHQFGIIRKTDVNDPRIYLSFSDPDSNTIYNSNLKDLNEYTISEFSRIGTWCMTYVGTTNDEFKDRVLYTKIYNVDTLDRKASVEKAIAPFLKTWYPVLFKPQISSKIPYLIIMDVPPGNIDTDFYVLSMGKQVFMTKLTDLNKKIKFGLHSTWMTENPISEDHYINARLYTIGFWVDMLIDYTQSTVVSSLKGRMYDENDLYYAVSLIPTVVDELIENPVSVIANILIRDLNYSVDDFTSWDNTIEYVEDSTKYESESPAAAIPKVAFSYGIDDDRKKGWEFCQWLASHYNLQIFKNYNNEIDIINLHEIYTNTPVGYEINIDDILFLADSGNKRSNLYQTGTDLIYNDIIIQYKRNNYNNSYQATYKLPDTYELKKSAIKLNTARDIYYGGKKITLTIQSPFIYNETDAKRLAEITADGQAEIHFYREFVLDFRHYYDYNSLTEQYKPGDIIYFIGSDCGIDFTSGRKFYIQDIIFQDSGREILIKAKSVDPISEF